MDNNKQRYVFAVFPEEGQNFWDANPELLNLNPYNQLFKKEGKRRSGRIMSAIWLCYDPKSKANLTNRDEKEILADIAENYLNEKKFPWKDYKNIITSFKEDCKTKLEKELEYWESELVERRIYQKSLPWDTERKEKDEMLKTQKTLFNDYLNIKKELDSERKEQHYHGGTHKSLLERQQS